MGHDTEGKLTIFAKEKPSKLICHVEQIFMIDKNLVCYYQDEGKLTHKLSVFPDIFPTWIGLLNIIIIYHVVWDFLRDFYAFCPV